MILHNSYENSKSIDLFKYSVTKLMCNPEALSSTFCNCAT